MFALDSNPDTGSGLVRTFDVLPDGRFVILQGATTPSGGFATKYTVTVNWFDELRRLALGKA